MGKVKTIIMGDVESEQAARQKAQVKRAQKKVAKEKTKRETEGLPADSNPKDQPPTAAPAANDQSPAASGENFSFPRGKAYLAAKSLVDKNKTYSPAQAIDLAKKTSYTKFDGSVEVHINVSDKNLRGTVALPHGTGKQVRVAVATDDLINSVSSGNSLNFDILVAAPEMMPKLARIAKILGPRGLMPNPKTGTIGSDPEKLAERLSAGLTQWKTEANAPIIHLAVGKVSFDSKKLADNFAALTKAIGKDKIRSVFVKATMGPAVKVQL